MTIYPELEFAIRRRDDTSYAVDWRSIQAGGETENRSKTSAVLKLDFDKLRSSPLDPPTAYAHALTGSFFQDQQLREALRDARTNAQAKNAALRVRVFIDYGAPELHSVYWELLQDPETHAPLFNGEQIFFSRFLSSSDGRDVTLRAKSDLKALVVIANPVDLEEWNLTPIKADAELARAQESLKDIEITALASPGTATLNTILEKLRTGYDILYLVCHGQLVKQTPYLYLEDEAGKVAPVVVNVGGDSGNQVSFVSEVRGLLNKPRLIVLGSCESAGDADRAAPQTLAALGPQLADAGVPAVLAMQGEISMEAVAKFMPAFFTALLEDGQIDRAMAIARGQLARLERSDYWQPVLFMRLRTGRIWYVPGFGQEDGKDAFDKWQAICRSVGQGRFVPILGPEFGDEIFGGTADAATKLAQEYASPLAAYEQKDLAKVAQYISVHDDPTTARERVQDYFGGKLAKWVNGATGAQAGTLPQSLDLAAQRCYSDLDNPYRIITDLKAPIYVNASYDTLLFRVLGLAGRAAEVVCASWRGQGAAKKPQPQVITPTPNQPWVYHVVGRFGQSDTIVLTEDDFFDYLIATSKSDLLLPALVGRLMQSSLLFLGFRLDDWTFRVLFRLIINSPGRETLSDLSHVGVQVDPDEQSWADVKRAREYLQSYFERSKNPPQISIYWGKPADFLKELRKHLAEAPAAIAKGATDGW